MKKVFIFAILVLLCIALGSAYPRRGSDSDSDSDDSDDSDNRRGDSGRKNKYNVAPKIPFWVLYPEMWKPFWAWAKNKIPITTTVKTITADTTEKIMIYAKDNAYHA